MLTSAKDVARYIGVNEKRCRELLAEGIIPSIQTGANNHTRYYTTEELIDFAFLRYSSVLGDEDISVRNLFLSKEIDKTMLGLERDGGSADIITVANLKGGVGKTTNTINIATSLAKLGQRVLIVDMDSQAQSSTYFDKVRYSGHSILSLFEMYQEKKEITTETVKEYIVSFDDVGDVGSEYQIDILPSEVRLIKKLENMRTMLRPEKALLSILEKVSNEYDFILCDTPPYPGLALEMSFYCANSVIISTKADDFSIEGLETTVEELQTINDFTERSIEIDSIFINSFSNLKHQKDGKESIEFIIDTQLGGKSSCELYVVKHSESVFGQAQQYQIPVIAYRTKPKDALTLSQEFLRYATNRILKKGGIEL